MNSHRKLLWGFFWLFVGLAIVWAAKAMHLGAEDIRNSPLIYLSAIAAAISFVASLVLLVMWFIETNWREIGLWFRWHRRWHDWADGPYHFPQTKAERKQLSDWARDSLARQAGWTFNSMEVQIARNAELAALMGSLSHPKELYEVRRKRHHAEKALREATKRTQWCFKLYYAAWDLFKDMDMLPEGYTDPEKFRHDHKPKADEFRELTKPKEPEKAPDASQGMLEVLG